MDLQHQRRPLSEPLRMDPDANASPSGAEQAPSTETRTRGQITDLFQFLQRKDYIKEREGYLMGEVIGDAIIREVCTRATLPTQHYKWTCRAFRGRFVPISFPDQLPPWIKAII